MLIWIKFVISGYTCPDSHLATACLDTDNFSASSSCANPLFFRINCSFSEKIISNYLQNHRTPTQNLSQYIASCNYATYIIHKHHLNVLIFEYSDWHFFYHIVLSIHKRNGFCIVYSLTAQASCSFLFLCLWYHTNTFYYLPNILL